MMSYSVLLFLLMSTLHAQAFVVRNQLPCRLDITRKLFSVGQSNCIKESGSKRPIISRRKFCFVMHSGWLRSGWNDAGAIPQIKRKGEIGITGEESWRIRCPNIQITLYGCLSKRLGRWKGLSFDADV